MKRRRHTFKALVLIVLCCIFTTSATFAAEPQENNDNTVFSAQSTIDWNNFKNSIHENTEVLKNNDIIEINKDIVITADTTEEAEAIATELSKLDEIYTTGEIVESASSTATGVREAQNTTKYVEISLVTGIGTKMMLCYNYKMKNGVPSDATHRVVNFNTAFGIKKSYSGMTGYISKGTIASKFYVKTRYYILIDSSLTEYKSNTNYYKVTHSPATTSAVWYKYKNSKWTKLKTIQL